MSSQRRVSGTAVQRTIAVLGSAVFFGRPMYAGGARWRCAQLQPSVSRRSSRSIRRLNPAISSIMIAASMGEVDCNGMHPLGPNA